MKVKNVNRHKAIDAKSSKFWCPSCDAQIISSGQKCKNCGAKEPHKKLSKKIPSFDWDYYKGGLVY
jgi:tRNA(Ile2) C34 agmatinyltransferase TiaS